MHIDPDLYEIFENQRDKFVKVFYFGEGATVEESKGKYGGIHKETGGEFLQIYNDTPVRLDRVISINGKPGPAFEEYNNYSISCTSCLIGLEGQK